MPIYLDPLEATVRKHERTHRFDTVQVPVLRCIGFLLILVLIWAREWYLPLPLLTGGGLGTLVICLAIYCVSSWVWLVLAPERYRSFVAGVFMFVDPVVYTVIIFLTGAEDSWLWVLLIVRVADQTYTSFARVVWLTHLNFILYLAMLYLASLTTSDMSWPLGLTKLLTMYMVSMYLSLTARTAEGLRRQTLEAIHLAQEELLARQRLTEILEKTSDVVLTTRLDGCPVYLNAAGRALLGLAGSEPLREGLPLPIAPREEQARLSLEALPVVLADGQWTGATTMQAKDGSRIPVSAVMIAHGPHGQVEFVSSILRDITYLVETQRRFERLARLQELILGSAQDGIFSLSANGRCTLINPAALKALGCTAEDLTGVHMHQVVHRDSDHGEEDCPLLNVLRTGRVEADHDDVFYSSDGRRIPVECSTAPIFESDHVDGMVVVFRDTTVRNELVRMKDEFISTVSHELRTPLTSIRGSLGLLNGGLFGKLAPKGQQMLELAVKNTDRLVRLINDILDIERLQAGKVTLEKQPFNVRELADNTIDALQGVADKHAVTLICEGCDLQVLADADRITQVLTNLVGNAIKFSPAGATVTVGVERRGSEVSFQVRDHGRGIPADKLGIIFDRFQQVDASDARDKGGTGLGLAISRAIVEQHGGRIWVESILGLGSTFAFSLPASAAAVGETAPEQVEGAEESPAVRPRSSFKVLVVEDDRDLSEVLVALVRQQSVEVQAASSVAAAIRASQEFRPDLLLLDLGLPGGSGFDVVAALRQDPERARTPLLIYTARELSAADLQRLTLGETRVFIKTRVTDQEFEAAIVSWLEKLGAGVTPPEQPEGT